MRYSSRLLTAIGSLVTIALSSTQVHASTFVAVNTTAPNGIVFTGGDFTLNTSAGLLDFLNVQKVSVQGVDPSVVTEALTPHPGGITRTALSLTSVVDGVWVDSSSGAITGLSSIGGVTWNAPFQNNLSHGGVLSITNLQIDFQSQRVYASLTGDFRGVGTAEGHAPYDSEVTTTLNNFHLWSFGSVQGNLAGGIVPAPLSGPYVSGIPPFSLGGLTITQQGYEHVVSALRLYGAGTSTLQAVTNYGSITTAVPEPASMSLLLSGLLGVAFATARTRQSRARRPEKG
ncbi:PEP-CTERM sorting domain-containing protein [Aquabacterium soli]|uniref:PEP-CTERM sorting domain-containing protein n=1 Tax=Aquabacterium soli TaxID=2493092 RepID=A0A3R8RZN3_9BURK|nr:PEP-CTERM sorting domain-containing protein [Aquabacterium soli]RRS02710.1 PEP-CTERM sorting domain-containing protein [Aquabacterium soli]